jgi:hypothetical protein
MQHRLRVPLAGLAALALLTACGGSPTATSGDADGGNTREDSDVAQAAKKVFDKFKGMNGQERTDELVA